MPRVVPEILRWARETAGYGVEEAARRIALKDTRSASGADRLQAIEDGEAEPTAALLSRMAKQYHRPLLTFYLAQIPVQADVGQDFRTLPERNQPGNALLSALLRDIKARQALAREQIEDDPDPPPPVELIGSRRLQDGVASISARLVESIAFERARFRGSRTTEEAFGYLRSCAENSGIFVLLAGDLGSWQTAIPVEVFRGFAIADPIAPFVVINDQDARSAWSFTLLHELAHLCLGEAGVSGSAIPAQGIERLCNDVAAHVLVDDAEIGALPANDLENAINRAAGQWRVSRSMIAYRLFRANRITQDRWQNLIDGYRQEWVETWANDRAAAREREGGPNYYTIRRHRVGAALLNLVRQGISEGNLTAVRAGKILGVKPMAVYPLIGAGAPPRQVA